MAERPNYTGSGRTLMTAPIRAAAPNPERDADRGTGQGLEAFGRGMASAAQSGWQAAQYQEQERRRAEALEKERQNNNRQIAANILDADLVKVGESLATDAEFQNGDDRVRAEKLDQIEKDVRGRMTKVYEDLGLDPNDPMMSSVVDERIARARAPQIAEGANLRFARTVAADFSSFVTRFEKEAPARDNFQALREMYLTGTAELNSLSNNRQSPENKARLRAVLERNVKSQADWLATTGVLSEKEISEGLERGMWNGTEAAALRNRVNEANRRTIDAREKEVNDIVRDSMAGLPVPADWKTYYANPDVQQHLAHLQSKGRTEEAKSVTRRLALGFTVNQLTSPMVSATGLPEGYTVPMLMQLRERLSTLAGRREFFGSRLKVEGAGEFSADELDEAAKPITDLVGQVEKAMMDGTPNRLFASHPKMMDYVRRNPKYMESGRGLEEYGILMEELQQAADIPSDARNRTPWEMTRMLQDKGNSPGEWPALAMGLATADRDGAIIHHLIGGLPKDFIDKNRGLTSALVLSAGAAALPQSDINRSYILAATKAISEAAAARQRGDIDTIEQKFSGIRQTATQMLVDFGGIDWVFDDSLDDEAEAGLNGKFDVKLSTSLQSFNNLVNGLSNTPYMAKATRALQESIIDQMIYFGFHGKPVEKGGNPNLARGMQEALKPYLNTWTVVPSNGSDTPTGQMRLTAVPVWGQKQDWFAEPNGSTMARTLAEQGTDEARVLESVIGYSRPLLGAGGMTQRNAAFIREFLSPLSDPLGTRKPERNLAWWAEYPRAWNELFTQTSRYINMIPGVSFNDSLMPHQSTARHDPALMAYLQQEVPGIFPNYDDIAIEMKVRDEAGGVRTVYIPISENHAKGTPYEEIARSVRESLSGIKGASDADKAQMLMNDSRYADRRFNPKDGNWYVYLKQGVVKGGFASGEGDAFGVGLRIAHKPKGGTEYVPYAISRAIVKDIQSTVERNMPRIKQILTNAMFVSPEVRAATEARAKEMATAAGEGNYEKYLGAAFMSATADELTLSYQALAKRIKSATTKAQ